jgi:hypothetical protein
MQKQHSNLMKTNKLSELTLEELYKQKNTLKSVLIAFSIVMLIACAGLFFVAIKSKNYALIAIIPGCMLTMLPNYIRFGQLNTEIKSRNSK